MCAVCNPVSQSHPSLSLNRTTHPPMASRPTPKPAYLFRPTHQELIRNSNTTPGDHSTRAVTHLEFISFSIHHQHHLALLTTDNYGWNAIWNLDSKRIQSLWHPHPHTQSIGGCLWACPLVTNDQERFKLFVLSQGRDHRLVLSQLLNYTNTSTISTITRANLKPTHKNPSVDVSILTHTPINAINFCKASSVALPSHKKIHSIVALPSLISEEFVDIFAIQIFETPKIIKIYEGLGNKKGRGNSNNRTGSVVAVQLYLPSKTTGLILLMIGYESGEVIMLKNEKLIGPGSTESGLHDQSERCMEGGDWKTVGGFKGHTEPILSMAVSIDPLDRLAGIAWSVAADRKIVRYELMATVCDPPVHPSTVGHDYYQTSMNPLVFETNQPGRFDVQVRSDGKVLGIYTWGGKLWLFDTTVISLGDPMEEAQLATDGLPDDPSTVARAPRFTLRPLAVLKIPTEPDHRSGVLAFAPYPPLLTTSSPTPPFPQTTNRLDSLAGLALLVASATAGQVVAWEVFPPTQS